SNAPAAQETATETPSPNAPTLPPTASETPSPTETPQSQAAAATVCAPTVTANTVANVRSGPGQVYNVIGSLPEGGTAKVAGKNFDGTWWYIEFAGGSGGFAWIAGSVTSAACIPDTLPSIAAPPTPIAPTSTPTNAATAAPTPTPTATSGGIILLPPIFILPTPTPTFILIFPLPIITIGP
ncbi:MAG: hypothetical protein LDL51_13580, partial [Chloroflexi bacterium]|nr:hypothetical protein [Chloroflexota bacterium]